MTCHRPCRCGDQAAVPVSGRARARRLLSLVLPIGPRLASPNGLALGVGLTFVAIGFALAPFSRSAVSALPAPASSRANRRRRLSSTGPYRFTRNPIYIGFVLALFRARHHPDQPMGASAADPGADRSCSAAWSSARRLISSGNSATPTANTRRACRAGSSSNIQLVGLGEFGALLDEAEARLRACCPSADPRRLPVLLSSSASSTRSRVRTFGSMVVSFSCRGSISPSP